jgi:hypothetical protein
MADLAKQFIRLVLIPNFLFKAALMLRQCKKKG